MNFIKANQPQLALLQYLEKNSTRIFYLKMRIFVCFDFQIFIFEKSLSLFLNLSDFRIILFKNCLRGLKIVFVILHSSINIRENQFMRNLRKFVYTKINPRENKSMGKLIHLRYPILAGISQKRMKGELFSDNQQKHFYKNFVRFAHTPLNYVPLN